MKLIMLAMMLLASFSFISIALQPECDYKVEIMADGQEFEKDDFKWRMRATKIEGKPANITGAAEIKDSDGKTAKSYKPWTSQPIAKQKTSNEYSPNLKPGSYEITAEISVGCNDTNNGNNIDSKKIRIKGEKEEFENKNESIGYNKIKTTEIPANKTGNELNQQMNNKIKNEEINESSTVKILENKTFYKNEPEQDAVGENNVVMLQNNGNKQIKATASAVQEQEFAYESSNEKAKGMIIVFLLGLSILLNIVLIWKR